MSIRSKKIAEGKTKIIWEVPGTSKVLIESKDDITAGDGAKHDLLIGKAVPATRTTVNCFKLLERAGIPNHFISEENDRTFRAKRVNMIPVELVARRYGYGSYLKRHPEVARGAHLGGLVLEYFAKDDPNHDPILAYDFDRGVVRRHNAAQPISPESLIDEEPITKSPFGLSRGELMQLGQLTIATFKTLEAAWAKQDVVMADLKIEAGRAPALVVADVIDNDSWRLWPGGDPEQMMDKQLYREGRLPLDAIADKYALVAAATDRFAELSM
ncbi:MAG TPA: phosphoribosylaminoimidazolesuccinocarboxamide synthase [Candidatus Saccharimonadales bacterium]|nr:phosphoribosylaminoimidazolesuccinocarboxamide synthase [Candidatus Saccharimonadales bacterium]